MIRPPVGPTGLVPTASGWKPSWATVRVKNPCEQRGKKADQLSTGPHDFVHTWIDHSNCEKGITTVVFGACANPPVYWWAWYTC